MASMVNKTREEVLEEIKTSINYIREQGRTKYFGMFPNILKSDEDFFRSELLKKGYASVDVRVCPRGIMDVIVEIG